MEARYDECRNIRILMGANYESRFDAAFSDLFDEYVAFMDTLAKKNGKRL